MAGSVTEVPVDHDRETPSSGRFDEAGDATRRTRLANERTFLAWWRTGLTAFAVSIATGKVVPAIAQGPAWPYAAFGVAFAALGVCASAYGFLRQRIVEQALRRGEYSRPHEGLMLALAGASVAVGFGVIVLLLVERS